MYQICLLMTVPPQSNALKQYNAWAWSTSVLPSVSLKLNSPAGSSHSGNSAAISIRAITQDLLAIVHIGGDIQGLPSKDRPWTSAPKLLARHCKVPYRIKILELVDECIIREHCSETLKEKQHAFSHKFLLGLSKVDDWLLKHLDKDQCFAQIKSPVCKYQYKNWLQLVVVCCNREAKTSGSC